MSEIISNENEQVVHHIKLLDTVAEKIEFLAKNNRPILNGERYLTDSELSEILKISRRTLQQWRTDKIISYIIFNGKCLYKESDIQALFEKRYHKASR